MNKELIKQVFDRDTVSRRVGKYLSLKERHRGDTELSKLLYEFNKDGDQAYAIKDIELVFRELEKAEAGKLIGQPGSYKFSWYVSPVIVGKYATAPGIERRKAAVKITINNIPIEVSNVEFAADLIKRLMSDEIPEAPRLEIDPKLA